MAGVAESKYGDSLDVSSIKLVNNPTNIHNRIRRNITKTKNAYNQIPRKEFNLNKINYILDQIKKTENEKQRILNSIQRYGRVSLSAGVNQQWQSKLNTIDRQLEIFNQQLVVAEANEKAHNNARYKSKKDERILFKGLRETPHIVKYNNLPKENEIRYGGKYHKTYKRHTNKRNHKRNKTKRNRN